MEFDNTKPIYLQIIDDVKKRLIRGEIKPGDKIPSQREFANEIKVNPNTVQRAYREMESMGLVETLRGQGTFICNQDDLLKDIKRDMASDVLKSFIQEMRSFGFSNEEMISLIQSWQSKI